MSTKILIAGFGTMGKYYAEKLWVHAPDWGVALAGIADISSEAFDLTKVDSRKYKTDILATVLQLAPQFSTVEEALLVVKPQIIINATNSPAHIEIIRVLGQYPDVSGFLTEKPLVDQLLEEREAFERLSGHFVSMNMITNFSVAATGLRDWLAQHPQLKLIGLEGVWGKDRRADTRPTPGIASDIIHPIGLMQSVFDAHNWQLQKANGLYGTLSTDRQGQAVECVYHYTTSFMTSVAPVRMDCSFAWQDQARRVSGFFQDDDGSYKIAELFLDEADDRVSGKRTDFFRIYDLSADFQDLRLVYESLLSSDDKLTAYLGQSIHAFHQAAPAAVYGLTGLAEEYDIGRMYGLLHPSDDKADLLNQPHIMIRDADPADSDKKPKFSRIDQASLPELKDRFAAFRPSYIPSLTPASRPAPAP